MPYSASIFRMQEDAEEAFSGQKEKEKLQHQQKKIRKKENFPIPYSSFASWEEAWSYTRRSVETQMPLLKVTISDPRREVSGYLGFNKFVSYLVKTTPAPFAYEVRRRFSDFVWLRNILVQRYPGMMIPSLPEKNYFATSAATFNFSGLQAPISTTTSTSTIAGSLAAKQNTNLHSTKSSVFDND